jgi:protocatechuate 3,4-dioxygenase beta subunit
VTQPGIVLYAYQTDARGIYPAAARLRGAAARHGRLRGWTRSDAMGRYAFDTIRPGAYPDGGEPQHIHLHVIEPRRCTYYIGDVLFADDPLLDAERRADAVDARGGSGIVAPYGDATRGWQATRDITLGLNVPGYDGCS